MELTYDPRTDTQTLVLREGVTVAETREDKPGVLLDYDAEDNLVALEVLDASRRIDDPRSVELTAPKG